MDGFQLGKLPIPVLKRTVMSMTGSPSAKVILGPKAGVDFAVVKLGGGFLVASSDPVTGVGSNTGWYAVNVSANDVATSGNRPQYMETVILLPEKAREEDLAEVSEQVHRAAKKLHIAVVGGHTEVTPGLGRPIVVATVFSFVSRYISAEGGKPGDTIMMTKTAGLEGTCALARRAEERGRALSPSVIRSARALEGRLSVVEEAVRSFRTGAVHAMHDCTEGGVLGAVYEMSVASSLGFTLNEDSVPIAGATRGIAGMLKLDPLKLLGSGSLLLAVEGGREKEVRRALRGTKVSEIGTFEAGARVLLKAGGARKVVRAAPTDEFWRAYSKLG